MEDYNAVITLLQPVIKIFLTYWVVLLLIYLFPYFVEILRKHRNSKYILILNLFLGWTIIGWAVSLVWAFTIDHPATTLSGPKKRHKTRYR